jgi:hypothetical protein
LNTEVLPMIEQMAEFTTARLEMEHHFGILEAWGISRRSGRSDPRYSYKKLEDTTGKLHDAMERIRTLDVIGEPSNLSSLDVSVRAYWIRLKELMETLRNSESTHLYSCVATSTGSKLSDRLEEEQAAQNTWRLIEQYREAVLLASKCCDAQNDALLNKLSRAYQKPDFCIRRDSVGSDCDRLLPTTLSWDDDWYVGKEIP